MEIVVNEWLLEYLRPDADKTNREIALRFIDAWGKKCDKVVIKSNSQFVRKFYTFMKKFEWDSDYCQCSKELKRLFRDSDKTIIIDDEDIKELPAKVIEKTPEDDRYLIELGYSYPNRVIVTTDRKLRDVFQEETHLKISLLEEFIREYL